MKKIKKSSTETGKEKIIGEKLSEKQKRILNAGIRKVVEEYGEALRMLGRD